MTNGSLSLLVVTPSGQYVLLQVPDLSVTHAEVDSEVVVEHLLALSHPLSSTPNQSHVSNTPVSISILHFCSPSFPPLTVFPQIIKLSSAFVTAYSSNRALAFSPTQLHYY